MKKIFLVTIAALMAAFSSLAADEARLMRFPTCGNNEVIFTYAGDLYSVPVSGGQARRLTSHIGFEMFAHVSPDGQTIAFTAQMDGNTEVFTMPVEGGEPKRITYTATLGRDDVGDRMGPNNIVMGWTPDSRNIVFRSRCYTFNDFTGQLFTVSAEGGMPTEIPLTNGGFCSFSPNGQQLAYNYVFREFRTWKRYEGGMADDIRIFDLKTKKSTAITDSKRQEVFPMWTCDGKEIYYLSDRDNDVMNLYCYDLSTKQSTQQTAFTDFDIKFPTIHNNMIAFEQGGYIFTFNTTTKESKKLVVEIENDMSWSRSGWQNVQSDMSAMTLSPLSDRLIVAAHGDLFSVAVKQGITYNLTNSCTENANSPDFAPDGKCFAFLSDRDGEQNIWITDVAANSSHALLNGFKGWIMNYEWSGDSKSIVWADKGNTLNITDLSTGKTTEIERSGLGGLSDFTISPDSRYVVFTRPSRDMNCLVAYEIATGKKFQITDSWYNSSNPSFSDDGKYLIFTSARNFSPSYGQTEWNHIYTDLNRLFILPLAKDATDPFAPKNDELKGESTEKADMLKASKSNEPKKEVAPIEYNFENCESRVIQLPVQGMGWGGSIRLIDNLLYYSSRGQTAIFNLETKENTPSGAQFTITRDGKRAILFSRSGGNSVRVIDRPRGKVAPEGKSVDMSGLKKYIDYHAEWAAEFEYFWRSMRDYFYDPNMHGVDWQGVHDKYAALVPYINHRSDLTYIVGEMIGELSVGHAYSGNGRHPEPERIKMGLLGARFAKDKSGYFRIERIIEGANWNKATRSPLTMDGVNVKKGDYVIAVNGRDLKDVKNIFETLVGTADQTTELTVNSKATTQGARKVLVTPIADESQLYYHAWVMENTRKVSEATNGEVGYIHIPDMGSDGLNEFVKHYYPQLSKKALIIDDRGNGGGNVSPMIIERLMRTPTYFTMHTGMTEGNVNPTGTFLGPKVLLMNEYSASDGDLFPYRFKYNKLGTSIGRRTWGGVVGYSGMTVSVDGGTLVTPSYAPYAADGSEFIIEGRGVEPDIELFNDPYKEFNGEDEQLNKAIEVALEKLKTERRDVPAIPQFPNKNRR